MWYTNGDIDLSQDHIQLVHLQEQDGKKYVDTERGIWVDVGGVRTCDCFCFSH